MSLKVNTEEPRIQPDGAWIQEKYNKWNTQIIGISLDPTAS